MNAAKKLSSLVICILTLPLYFGACILPGAGNALATAWENEAKSIIS